MKNVGLIASSVAHVVLMGVGMFSLPAAETHDVSELEILPIELVSISDVTDVRKGEATAKPADLVKEEIKKVPEPEKEEPKPVPKVEPKPKEPAPPKQPEPAAVKAEPEPTPPAPKPEPEVAPKPEAKVEEVKPSVPDPIAALPKVRPKPPKKAPVKKAAPKPTEVARKSEFDADALKALANKANQTATAANSGEIDQQASFGSRNGTQAAAMTQSELDALRAQVAQCWSPPVGAADASQLRVRIEFGLDRQGNVTRGPEPIEFPASQFGVAAVESAIRAVRRCAPYNLPAEKYNTWRQVRITFDPQDMF